MAVKPIGTTALTWGSLLGRGNREPIDATQLNYSYTDLLWELNQRTVSYQIGANNGGSGNYYVGLITAVPYVNEDDKRKDSHYTVDADGNKKLETIDMKGPWYVSYKGTDKGRGTVQNKYGFVPDGNPNTYYADRIVLKQEMDYTLDNGFVRKTQLGTYYTGVGHWYDSYTKSKTYANGLECPDGVYFPTTSYAEIFNDYTHNVATGIFSHAEGGSTTASGDYSHAEGGGTTASGDSSHAEGWSTTASGGYSHAEGNLSYAGGIESHAEGSSTKANGDSSHAEGISTKAIGQSSHAEGNLSYAGGIESHAEGSRTKAIGESSHAEGYYATASGYQSHAEGYSTTASGDRSHAEGDSTTANGDSSHAEGYSTKANGDSSHAEGYSTKANGDRSHAEGYSTTASGDRSHAEGDSTTASGIGSHAEGGYTKASGYSSHAEGYYATASGDYSHAEGDSTTASGNYSHAEGLGTTASGDSSHAEGDSTTASGNYSHAEGDSTTASGNYSHAEGYSTTASGDRSHAEGDSTTASGNYSHAEGHFTYVYSTAENSHAEGTGSYTKGVNAHAENSSYANGKNSHSGGEATAGGVNSFAHGVKGTLASGVNSVALVSGTSSGEGSVAMNYSKATGKGSVAIGLGTIASGEYSLSQGHETRANNHDSHAEGYGTNASGDQSHTEGIVTTTNGLASHAEGQGSTTGTNATAAHAEGSYTIANNESEHAQGKYNVSDTENSGTLFTIGNGTDNDKRHNVVGIYHNGDINIEGPNTTNHNTGYFKTTVDGTHTEVVRGNYTQTIGTASKNNTCNITVNGNTTNRFNGTSDTRTTGATYEGYGSTFISTTKGAKYIYSYSTTYIHSNDNVTNTTAGTRTNITDGYVSETNKASIGTYTTGDTYQYTSRNKTDAVYGARTNISSSTVRVTNKTNVIITTGSSHTESINDERSVTVGTHDSLTVNYGGRTEKITGEKITQVVLGNINAYTDDYHDTRLHTRSTYVETVHTYIGDKTNTYISGNYSVGLGQGIKVSSNTNVSTGKYNKDEVSYFAVGIGTSDTNRKNAFWISQGTTVGTNGVGYFSNNTYIYGNTYDPSQYPNNKEDKSWSVAVTYNMYRNSYTYLYNTVNDKFNNIFPRLAYLEKWCMWQSGLPNNKSTYIWSGTLAQFNSLTSKPENTTFIISN